MEHLADAVIERYMVSGRYMCGKSVVGYAILDTATSKEYAMPKEAVYKLAENGELINSEIKVVNGEKALRGKNGTKITELPVIQLNKGKDGEVNKKDNEKSNTGVAELSKRELYEFAQKIKFICRDNSRELSITPEMERDMITKSANCQLYIQCLSMSPTNGVQVSEYSTIAVKLGKQKGVVMRVSKRGSTAETFDVRVRDIDVRLIDIRTTLGILGCGINKRYNNEQFGRAELRDTSKRTTVKAYDIVNI